MIPWKGCASVSPWPRAVKPDCWEDVFKAPGVVLIPMSWHDTTALHEAGQGWGSWWGAGGVCLSRVQQNSSPCPRVRRDPGTTSPDLSSHCSEGGREHLPCPALTPFSKRSQKSCFFSRKLHHRVVMLPSKHSVALFCLLPPLLGFFGGGLRGFFPNFWLHGE